MEKVESLGISRAVSIAEPDIDGFQRHVAEKLGYEPVVSFEIHPGIRFPATINWTFPSTKVESVSETVFPFMAPPDELSEPTVFTGIT